MCCAAEAAAVISGLCLRTATRITCDCKEYKWGEGAESGGVENK